LGLVNPVARREYKKQWDLAWERAHGVSYCTQWARDHPGETQRRHAKRYLRIKTDPIVRAQYRAKFTAGRLALKREVFEAYGGARCACCCEIEIEFLCLDHIRNDGNAHRKKLGGRIMGMRFYYWLKRHGFPKEFGLQVLCFNCNNGKRINGGVCPHDLSR